MPSYTFIVTRDIDHTQSQVVTVEADNVELARDEAIETARLPENALAWTDDDCWHPGEPYLGDDEPCDEEIE